uniref:Uncharacterized protein n=1 Tax=Elaeophora elaphi TaxID=1147741 RepID=A0A0R3RXQ2_9BILA
MFEFYSIRILFFWSFRAFIEIGITNTEQYERKDYFFIVLEQPIWAKKMSDLRKVQERFLKRIERKKNESVRNLNKDSESIQNEGILNNNFTAG